MLVGKKKALRRGRRGGVMITSVDLGRYLLGAFIGLAVGGISGYQLGKGLFLRLLFTNFPEEAKELSEKIERLALTKKSEAHLRILSRTVGKKKGMYKRKSLKPTVPHAFG